MSIDKYELHLALKRFLGIINSYGGISYQLALKFFRCTCNYPINYSNENNFRKAYKAMLLRRENIAWYRNII
jgi:hypothetical protein